MPVSGSELLWQSVLPGRQRCPVTFTSARLPEMTAPSTVSVPVGLPARLAAPLVQPDRLPGGRYEHSFDQCPASSARMNPVTTCCGVATPEAAAPEAAAPEAAAPEAAAPEAAAPAPVAVLALAVVAAVAPAVLLARPLPGPELAAEPHPAVAATAATASSMAGIPARIISLFSLISRISGILPAARPRGGISP